MFRTATPFSVLAFLTLAAIGAPWALSAHAVELEVVVTGLHSSEGQALIALHRAPDSPEDTSVTGAPFAANAQRPADSDAVVVVFSDLPPGDYAVAAFHDLNGNGELDANFVGMPTEGYGFSNDARGFMGPARFTDAAVTVGGDLATHRVPVPVHCPGARHGD